MPNAKNATATFHADGNFVSADFFKLLNSNPHKTYKITVSEEELKPEVTAKLDRDLKLYKAGKLETYKCKDAKEVKVLFKQWDNE